MLLLLQAEPFSQWLFKQSVIVVLLVSGLVLIARYFIKQGEKKDADLSTERGKHEENLKDQVDKSERRMDRFDVALERRDSVAREQVRAMEQVSTHLERLTQEIRSK